MQYGISEWTIYIPFIQYNENLLVLRGTIEPYAVNKHFSILVTWQGLQNGGLHRHCKIYKRPYLLNRSIHFHKICCKMLVSPKPFFWSEIKSLLVLPFKTENTWATSWENLFMPYTNNKGKDQPDQIIWIAIIFHLPIISIIY